MTDYTSNIDNAIKRNEDAPIILEYPPQCNGATKSHEFILLNQHIIQCAHCSLLIEGDIGRLTLTKETKNDL